eukprot:CAMPEP_0181122748 /NCGR_PEP_ID=MMETSP1071-20121207/25491_1 /TAXON_ID=35127 /ORGANISM="Thalassiosira sp., Strain NH16" /LENGTH=64 /DNA_ID=CAMNT_0023207763 /DNA_START=125 /DNA_END=315 /DNA_ORIENTATION=-
MFCPACEEEVSSPQQDGICLTCGEELVDSPLSNNANQQPSSSSSARQRDNADAAAITAMALFAS